MIEMDSHFNETVRRAIEKFGAANQLSQMQEESAELIQAISKLNRAKLDFEKVNAMENLLEEIADNIILLTQVIIISNVTDEKMKNVLNRKLMKLQKYLEV